MINTNFVRYQVHFITSKVTDTDLWCSLEKGFTQVQCLPVNCSEKVLSIRKRVKMETCLYEKLDLVVVLILGGSVNVSRVIMNKRKMTFFEGARNVMILLQKCKLALYLNPRKLVVSGYISVLVMQCCDFPKSTNILRRKQVIPVKKIYTQCTFTEGNVVNGQSIYKKLLMYKRTASKLGTNMK